MQVVIPMSGVGERFRQAGYKQPKPLIEVDGKPVIAHVVDMFPSVDRFHFVCNADHLADPQLRMRATLSDLCREPVVHSIAPHKLGPVHSVLQVMDALTRNEPVIVNYCDFTCYWDFSDFCHFVAQSKADGIIPAYRGFHPHSLGSTYYAYCQHREGWLTDIKEKEPFTREPMTEFASSGTYYFRTAELLRDTFERTVEQNLNVGGEYYVSLAYRPMLDDHRRIAIYELQHFMQWGTPVDIEDYRYFSDLFRHLAIARIERVPPRGTLLLPMAGTGQRFRDRNIHTPKPLIEVCGKPMVLQALNCLPPGKRTILVSREELWPRLTDRDALLEQIPNGRFVMASGHTEGQAMTCMLAASRIPNDEPLTIGACDNGALFSTEVLQSLIETDFVDVIVWGARGHPGARRRPELFSWIDSDNQGRIRRISLKQPLTEPARDPVVVGTFMFRRASQFLAAANRMLDRAAKVNDEYYVDTCINDAIALGMQCVVFEVDYYLGWGTPDELNTFRYWQSCFHKWRTHPYKLGSDPLISASAVPALESEYAHRVPERPS